MTRLEAPSRVPLPSVQFIDIAHCFAFHNFKCALFLTEMEIKSYAPTETHPEI